jgi:trans-2,3-dihydro-3-hydroxyanthranilate isomerase
MTKTPTRYQFQTVDVFTQQRFGGNPLAVFFDARGLTDEQMQSLAREFNLSETTFVLPPQDAANTARVRIFNRTSEMPFAGHPSIGTAFVLAGSLSSKVDTMRFEVPAGIVTLEIERDAMGSPIGAKFQAPQALSLGETIEAQVIANCLGLDPSDVMSDVHPPIIASVGNPYVIAQMSRAALSKCVPNIEAFKISAASNPSWHGRFSLHVYAQGDGCLFARMFAPLAGTYEDPATGSANAPLCALLLSCGDKKSLDIMIHQGIEMGRPSLLFATAMRQQGQIVASVSGRCVPVLYGEARV